MPNSAVIQLQLQGTGCPWIWTCENADLSRREIADQTMHANVAPYFAWNVKALYRIFQKQQCLKSVFEFWFKHYWPIDHLATVQKSYGLYMNVYDTRFHDIYDISCLFANFCVCTTQALWSSPFWCRRVGSCALALVCKMPPPAFAKQAAAGKIRTCTKLRIFLTDSGGKGSFVTAIQENSILFASWSMTSSCKSSLFQFQARLACL